MPYFHDEDHPGDAAPDRVVDGTRYVYDPTAGPGGPGCAEPGFDPAELAADPHVGPVVRHLRSVGVRAVRVLVDGGNDEGAAFFSCAVLEDSGEEPETGLCYSDEGEAFGFGLLAPDPRGVPEGMGLGAAGRAAARENTHADPHRRVRDALDNLAEESGCRLFGGRWGVGEYRLFGRVEANLVTGNFTDLPVDDPPDLFSRYR